MDMDHDDLEWSLHVIIHHKLYTLKRVHYEVFSLHGYVEEVITNKQSVVLRLVSNFTQGEMQAEHFTNFKKGMYVVIAVSWNYGLPTLEISPVGELMKLI